MGYNTWNAFHCNINQDLVREMIVALSESGLADVGYTYFNIGKFSSKYFSVNFGIFFLISNIFVPLLDDCWASTTRYSNGTVIVDNTSFPDGIKPLADLAHSYNLKFGIYTTFLFQT